MSKVGKSKMAQEGNVLEKYNDMTGELLHQPFFRRKKLMAGILIVAILSTIAVGFSVNYLLYNLSGSVTVTQPYIVTIAPKYQLGANTTSIGGTACSVLNATAWGCNFSMYSGEAYTIGIQVKNIGNAAIVPYGTFTVAGASAGSVITETWSKLNGGSTISGLQASLASQDLMTVFYVLKLDPLAMNGSFSFEIWIGRQ